MTGGAVARLDNRVSLIAVTVIGHDRPGIIADTTAVLAELGLNLEDSTMTLLRGHFAMMLLCQGSDVDAATVEAGLRPLAADGQLIVSARSVPDEDETAPAGRAYLVTVHGGDRPGIVSAVSRVIADAGGNITDLTTRLTGDLYLVVAEVDLPVDADPAAITSALDSVGRDLGVEITWRQQEIDVL